MSLTVKLSLHVIQVGNQEEVKVVQLRHATFAAQRKSWQLLVGYALC